MAYLGQLTCTVILALVISIAGCGGASAPEGDETLSDASAPRFDANTRDPERVLNEAPTATITAPSEGQVIQQGDPVSFSAVVGDKESPRETLSVQWLSSIS